MDTCNVNYVTTFTMQITNYSGFKKVPHSSLKEAEAWPADRQSGRQAGRQAAARTGYLNSYNQTYSTRLSCMGLEAGGKFSGNGDIELSPELYISLDQE